MDGFCWQGELDLTLFYKIGGYFDNREFNKQVQNYEMFL